MPDQTSPQVGALSQAAGMIPTAAAGNATTAQLLQNILANSSQKQSYLEQQQAAYEKEMAQYADMVAKSRDPSSGANQAGLWGNIAAGAAKLPPTWGNLGAMIGNMGVGAASFAQGKQQVDLENQQKLTKLREDYLNSAQRDASQTAVLKALSAGTKPTAPTIKVVDGKLVAARLNPATGEIETEVLTGSQDQLKVRMFQTFYNKAVENEVPNPEIYAQTQVEKMLAQFGGTTVKGNPNNIPGVRPAQPTAPSLQVTVDEQQRRDTEAQRLRTGEQTGELPPWPKMPAEQPPSAPEDVKLSPEDAAIATRLMARINANPAAAEKDTATLNALMKKYETPAPAMTYLDKPKRKLEEATATEAGKALGAEQQDLNMAAASSSQMIGQLDLLKKLYLTPNIPEGRFANELQAVRSGLKTIGIDVGDEVGAADMASSIAGKMALLTRTADGKNLMPGAMSDFEQRILRALVPGLEGTAQGRAALIDVMQQIARSRMRFAEEANKMAEANRGILPPEWNTRKQRVMKEEMARLAQVNAEIAARFQGAR